MQVKLDRANRVGSCQECEASSPEQAVYEITLRGGTMFRLCHDHLWQLETLRKEKRLPKR